MDALNTRHKLIEYFLGQGQWATAEELRDSLKNIKNVPRILQRMKLCMRPTDFQAILKVA